MPILKGHCSETTDYNKEEMLKVSEHFFKF